MHWVDLCGSPGSGKSTLADHLWPPHAVLIDDKLPPAQWHDFLNEITRLFHLISGHWSLEAAIRMNNRSIRKIATVARMQGDGPYIQTALAQRGLGFGWRLNDLGIDLNELRHYFRLMPVSIGVAVTRCPTETVIERNHGRTMVKETAHENRGFMVSLMQEPIRIALEVLRERNIPIIEIDTTQPIDDARRRLVEFAGQKPFNPASSGPCCEVEVFSAPPWWQRPGRRTSVPLAHRTTVRRADEDGTEHRQVEAHS